MITAEHEEMPRTSSTTNGGVNVYPQKTNQVLKCVAGHETGYDPRTCLASQLPLELAWLLN